MLDKLNLGELELDIFKICNVDRSFMVKMLGCLEPQYFKSSILKKLFIYYKEFFKQYDNIPTKKIIKDFLIKATNETESFITNFVAQIFDGEADDLDKKYILEQVILFARRARMKDAILQSVEYLNEDKFAEIIETVTDALKFNINVNLGFDLYDVDKRYRLILSNNENRMETGYKILDDVLQGGWTRKEIFCVMGPPGIGKSIFLVNFGMHALINGYNVVHYTFEMSEERLGMRYDAVATHISQHLLKECIGEIKQRYKTIQSVTKSRLKIKEFPTATATIFDIEAHLEQLKMYENFTPDLIIVDYGDIMRSTRQTKNPYEEQGWIFRELRGLAIKWNVALLTGTQARRDALDPKGGTKEIIGMEQTADSMEKNRILDVLFSIIQSKNLKDQGKIAIYFAKNRNGQSGTSHELFINYKNFSVTEDTAAQTKGKGMKIVDEELATMINNEKKAYRDDEE